MEVKSGRRATGLTGSPASRRRRRWERERERRWWGRQKHRHEDVAEAAAAAQKLASRLLQIKQRSLSACLRLLAAELLAPFELHLLLSSFLPSCLPLSLPPSLSSGVIPALTPCFPPFHAPVSLLSASLPFLPFSLARSLAPCLHAGLALLYKSFPWQVCNFLATFRILWISFCWRFGDDHERWEFGVESASGSGSGSISKFQRSEWVASACCCLSFPDSSVRGTRRLRTRLHRFLESGPAVCWHLCRDPCVFRLCGVWSSGDPSVVFRVVGQEGRRRSEYKWWMSRIPATMGSGICNNNWDHASWFLRFARRRLRFQFVEGRGSGLTYFATRRDPDMTP